MILYSSSQIAEAWLYDCEMRHKLAQKTLSIEKYEMLFSKAFEDILCGKICVRLDIFIPKDMLNSVYSHYDLEDNEKLC
ncbi:MAG: hypothetical protein GOVbin1578_35 [Prokaryotic dsDNA virus sp.]|nr:MAG: hypothetical protein GOVbin1578_35 [Prokaryotic dsDNA virus sp.]|tara:strand:- start:4064 stop:4300 length:237 start_codon:yes stop_codon:yes gene_type:complete